MDDIAIAVKEDYDSQLFWFNMLANDDLLINIEYNHEQATNAITKFPDLWKSLNTTRTLKYFIMLCPFEDQKQLAQIKLFKNKW